MLNSTGSVIARNRDAETATYCWNHSEHPTVHSHPLVDASPRTANNSRMSGTHRNDGSSRASTLYRHPQDASQYADSNAAGKQQASATLHGVLAKNPATLNGTTARESHHYDADAYAKTYGDDSHNHPDPYPKVVSNTGCYATECLQSINGTWTAMNPYKWMHAKGPLYPHKALDALEWNKHELCDGDFQHIEEFTEHRHAL